MNSGGDGLGRARFHSRRREDATDEDVVREVKVRHSPGPRLADLVEERLVEWD